MIFTGASATFLLMYLVLWHSYTDSVHLTSQHGNNLYSNTLNHQSTTAEKTPIIEKTTFCEFVEVKLKIQICIQAQA